jgi:hypothetical protein
MTHGGGAMTDAQAWTCPTCKTGVSTAFCPTCGERPLHARELTLRGLLQQVFEAFTDIDSRLIRSFRYLISRPGSLTLAYLEGCRKPYIGPVPLFLIANVLFFATESLSGGKIFTTPLDSHLHTQPWSELIQGSVARRLETLQTTLDVYAPVFDQAIAMKARSLIIFMALSFALGPWIAFYRRRDPLMAHAVFSLHLYTFLLLVFCLATVIPPIDMLLGGSGFASEPLDHMVAITLLIVCAAYLYFAIGTVYGARGLARIVKSLALTVAVAAIVLGYRFVLLWITLYST